MMKNSSLAKLTPMRRVILLVGGGLLAGLFVLTLSEAVPRPVDVVVLIPVGRMRRNPSHTVISTGERVVIEDHASAHACSTGRLRYHFWLEPVEHRLEFTSRGCAPQVWRFDPSLSGEVIVRASCSDGGREQAGHE